MYDDELGEFMCPVQSCPYRYSLLSVKEFSRCRASRIWLERARRSDSAEPMTESVYRKAPLTALSWEKLQAHPQFA